MASISPTPKLQFFAANGTPLVGGKLYSYAAGTTTPQATYTDAGGGTANANPIILDSRGEASVWLGSLPYKLRLTTATDVDIWTVDNVEGQATLAQLAASGGSALIGFLQAGTGAQPRTVQAKLRDEVSIKDFNVSGTGGDDSSGVSAALSSGARRIYVPPGTYSLQSVISITLANDLEIYGPGRFVYTGAASISPLFTVQCAGYSFAVRGLTFDGDNLVPGAFRIENTAAMSSNTLPSCYLEGCTLIDFRMHTASIWNNGAYIAGGFERVEILNNNVRNITRAAGTGTPGTNGTSGITVQHYDSSKFVRNCIHSGNAYSNVTSDDALGSIYNVDLDGFKFFAPLPSTSSGQYAQSVLTSMNNTYRNCRGRALKIQAIGSVIGETVIRDDDYTAYGGSTEVNFQLGVGTVTDCTFIYRPYNGGATSPIQSALTLVGFFQGSDYSEDTGSAIVSGIQVLSSIGAGVGTNITTVLDARVGAGVATPSKPLVSLSNVSINKNPISWVAQVGYEGTTYGVLRMDNIVVPALTYSAVATNGTDTNFDIVATNIFNIDGLTTPANAKPFVTDTLGVAVGYAGMISGSFNQGFVQKYNVGADLDKAPLLHGAALADEAGAAGGAASVQSVSLADDATAEFDRRFFNSSRGLFAVSVNFEYTSQGLFAAGSNQIHKIAAASGDVFSVSTSGTNPDVDNKLNLWFTGGKLNVKNRLGDSYVVTVMFIG
jgi:hypothetical protein